MLKRHHLYFGGALAVGCLVALLVRGYRSSPTAASGPIERTLVPLGTVVAGPESSPLTVVVFVDYACEPCRELHQTLEAIRQEYPNELRVSVRQFPLLKKHPAAEGAARAVLAAAARGRGWEMHRRLSRRDDLSAERVLDDAAAVGLSADDFRKDMDAEHVRAALRADRALGAKLKLRQLPTLFMNGRLVDGIASRSELEPLVRAELERARRILVHLRASPTDLYAALARQDP